MTNAPTTSTTVPSGSQAAPARIPTLPELIAENERELGQRRKYYPRWLQDGRISQADADHRTACSIETVAVLKALHLGLSYTSHFIPQPNFGLTPELAASLEAAGFKDVAVWLGGVGEALRKAERNTAPLFDKKPLPDAAANTQQRSLL